MSTKTTYIFDFAQGAFGLITDPKLRDVFKTVAKYMDAVEALGVLSGADKLKWVLAKLPEVIADFLRLKDVIVDFITRVKSAYNSLRNYFD